MRKKESRRGRKAVLALPSSRMNIEQRYYLLLLRYCCQRSLKKKGAINKRRVFIPGDISFYNLIASLNPREPTHSCFSMES